MDNLGELIPKLDLVEELYRLAEFQVLKTFLSSLQEEAYKDLLLTEPGQDINRTRLIDRITLLGTIIELPKVVKAAKVNVQKTEELLNKFRKTQED